MTSEQRQEGWVVVRGRAGALTQEIEAGIQRLVSDEPAAAGGTEKGPTPYDLLLAALGSCTSMTLELYARRKQWPLEGVTVRLRHSRVHAQDCEACESETPARLTLIEREIELAGALDGEQRKRLLEIADRCPVHLTLTSEITIKTREHGRPAEVG
jgi:putative redox protein